jgi:hypothetical protein
MIPGEIRGFCCGYIIYEVLTMDAIRGLRGLNLNFLGLVAVSLTAGATTVTLTAVATGGILTVCRDGMKATLSAGAKAFAKYKGDGTVDSAARTLVATASAGQAAAMVVGLKNVSGTETLVCVIGEVCDLDAAGNFVDPGGLQIPYIGDSIVPVALATIKNPAGSGTATFTFGTTNWNATDIATDIADIAALPRRPLVSVSV